MVLHYLEVLGVIVRRPVPVATPPIEISAIHGAIFVGQKTNSLQSLVAHEKYGHGVESYLEVSNTVLKNRMERGPTC